MNPIDGPEVLDGLETDENPWLGMWLAPKRTMERLLDRNTSIATIALFIYLGGVCFGLNQSELKAIGDIKGSSGILFSAFFISGLGGLITYQIFIWAIDFCASWFDGRGTFKQTQL